MPRQQKSPESFKVDTTGVFAEDNFNADEASYMDPSEERELMAWLKPDEQAMWAAAKETRRRSIPILLRRMAALRQGEEALAKRQCVASNTQPKVAA